ncbi:enoyl-CoA hydratase [Rhodobacterales bacterium HKCCE2091]|nr:enoyl-CoA hydratase [Rhodobacterales bacterium HKCCE2091]
MTAPLRYSAGDGIARIVFSRPDRLNAIDVELAEAFEAAIGTALSDPAVRVILLTGEGRAFMAGGDVRGMVARESREMFLRGVIEPMHRAILRLAEAPVLTVAAAQGPVAGAGMSLALNADMLIAADSAIFDLAYIRLGTVPDCGGSHALTRLAGPRRALDIALTGEALTAAEAREAGLVTRVVPAAELSSEAEALAARLAAGPAEALARTKALIRSAAGGASLTDQLAAEQAAFLACAATPDFEEGIDAFLTRRKPGFGPARRAET